MSTSGWMLLCVTGTFLGFLLPRRRSELSRGPAGLPDEATFRHPAHRGVSPAPSLRAGLTRDSARKAVCHLRVLLVGDAGSEARIGVEDDGRGMTLERARSLLDGDSRRGRDEGGIGLANVDARLRQIYGEDYGLVVESELDAGTKVNLRVPKFHLW
jgi:hypothetical protein